MNVNLTPEEMEFISELISNNALAHRVLPLPDTPRAMAISMDILRKFKRVTLHADKEQEKHDARARKLLEDL